MIKIVCMLCILLLSVGCVFIPSGVSPREAERVCSKESILEYEFHNNRTDIVIKCR